jgi:hypothetical protein
MASTDTPQMTVLHLETGHVVAAATCGKRKLTVDDMTGGTYLAVRLPKTTDQVNITPDLLTAAIYARDDDALDRPLEYRVDPNLPALLFGGVPIDLAATTGPHWIDAPDGTAVLSLWQVGHHLEVGRSVLASGLPDAAEPILTDAQIHLCAGEPLAYKG